MLKILISCLCIYPICNTYAFEKDSLQLNKSMDTPDKVVFDRIYQNASLAHFRPDAFNHGDIGVGYNYSDLKNTAFLQEGTSINQYRIAADGFVVNNNRIFWGNISYKRSYRKNVRWNNVYDYTRVGPNLLADSVGGNASGEEYSLLGGLSIKHNKWTFGGKIGYIAGQSYRKIDPRPNATSTDLYLQLSASYNLLDDYQIGLSFNGGRYRETVKISVEEERGNSEYNFYPFKGFGLYDLVIFKSNMSSYSAWYEGQNYGGELFFVPQNKDGLLGSIKFNYSFVEPDYSGGTSGSLFRTVYRTYTTAIDLGWQKYTKDMHFFVKLNYDYYLGKNIEYTYYSVSSGSSSNQQTPIVNYYLLSLDKFYTRKTSEAGLSGGIEWFSAKNIKWIKANLTYHTDEERYLYPQYKMRFERIMSSLEVGGEFHLKNTSVFISKLEVFYSPSQSSSKLLPDTRLFDLTLKPNISIMEADLFGVNGSLSYQYKLANNRRLYTSVNGRYCDYKHTGDRYSIGFSVGVKY